MATETIGIEIKSDLKAHRLDGFEWNQSATGSDRTGGDLEESLEKFWTHGGEI